MNKISLPIPNIIRYIFVLCLLTLGACKKGGNVPAPPPVVVTTFINPIMNGADPWIIKQGVQYYYTQTSGNRVALWKSDKVSTLASASSVDVFRPAAGLPYSNNIWAPELHYLDNKWYIYFTGGSGPDETQRTWVLENPGADPAVGTWTMKGRLFSPDADFWAIDGTTLTHEGQHYFLWSGRPNPAIQDQQIYIAKMLNPWTLDTKSTLITTPTFAWERVGGPVNEAPQILKNTSGKVYMVYSASGCWTDDYTLGMLTLKTGGNPLMATEWEKGNQPIFTKNPSGRAFGPGHNAFFKSPDGSEDWIMYHANNNTNEGCGEKRNVRIQPFTWNASGAPQFGTPVSTSTAIKKPSGE